jgi:hypothetical protein
MAKMTNDELLAYRNAAEANSIHASDELNAANRRAYDYYCGNPLGNEVDGESQVISTDVFDLVEADMPSLVRVFLGANDIMKFTPVMDTELERQTSEEKTKYINHLIRNQPSSYKTIFDWLKGAEIYKYSAVNYGYEEEDTVKVVEYEGLTEDEMAEVAIELQLLEQDGATVDFEEVKRPQKDKFKDLKATIKKTVGRYFVRYIDPESFVISSGATSEDDAETIGHDDVVTKSDLVAMGYSINIVKGLPSVSAINSSNKDNRLRDQGGTKEGNSLDWTGELVKLETRYIKADKDGDGIAERLRVVSVSETLLHSEPYEIAPYAVICSNMMPGQLIGKSRADAVMETQEIKTTLLRQTMMNMYQVNSARMAVNKNVNMDDLLTQRIGGLVRTSGEDNPLNHMAPLPVPFIGDKALMVLQYADSARAQRTGSLMANQALDSDRLGQETATRFEGVKDASAAKIELVARGHAETGFRRLYQGMLWTVAHYQKEKTEIMVLGKPMTIDPRRWLSDQPIICNVGLGAGDDEQIMQNMSSLLAASQQLQATGSPLTDMSKQYNILSRIVKAMNQTDVGEFFNNPQQPQELLQAQVEQLQLKNQQLEQMAQGNPLAEAEEVKAQALLIKAQATQNLDIAKLQEDQRQFNEEMQAKTNKTIADLEAKYTELELKYNTDVPNQGMGK